MSNEVKIENDVKATQGDFLQSKEDRAMAFLERLEAFCKSEGVSLKSMYNRIYLIDDFGEHRLSLGSILQLDIRDKENKKDPYGYYIDKHLVFVDFD